MRAGTNKDLFIGVLIWGAVAIVGVGMASLIGGVLWNIIKAIF